VGRAWVLGLFLAPSAHAQESEPPSAYVTDAVEHADGTTEDHTPPRPQEVQVERDGGSGARVVTWRAADSLTYHVYRSARGDVLPGGQPRRLYRRVAALPQGRQPPGRHAATVTARHLPASGAYFYRLETSRGTRTGSLTLVR
jgi:hypothetical protein